MSLRASLIDIDHMHLQRLWISITVAFYIQRVDLPIVAASVRQYSKPFAKQQTE